MQGAAQHPDARAHGAPPPNAQLHPAPPGPQERAIVFGPHRGLVGVVTHPTAGATNDAGPAPRRAVVMANIGVMHHVGPFRLYVELARDAATLGWHALRFDLSGLGDSAPRSGERTSAEQTQADVRSALDWLEQTLGVREVVLVGLCSGVDSMHPVAVADPRVVGAVFVDGYTYPTWGYYLRHHTLRYLQLERWRRAVRRRVRRLRAGTPNAPASETPDDVPQGAFQREYPTRARFCDDVARVTARGARLLFVFTGTFDGHFNAERQMGEILGRRYPRETVDVALFRGADHLFTGARQSAKFFGRVQRWLAEFPSGARQIDDRLQDEGRMTAG